MSFLDSLPIFLVDAFASQPFKGNPAAVCLVSITCHPQVCSNAELMQKIASEMNLSETAFVIATGNPDTFTTGDSFSLRWFTPSTEVNLCGHATLASAAVLFRKLSNTNPVLQFDTLSGILSVCRNGKLISLNFPLNPSISQTLNDYTDLLKAILDVTLIQEIEYSPNTKKLLVRLKNEVQREQLKNLVFNISSLPLIESSGRIKGVILTLKGTKENGCLDQSGECFDFVSRYFAPWVGIPEDPVTGSAHTVLASYWSKQLDKNDLYAQQCSTRGGEMRIVVKDDRVEMSGQATITLEGRFNL
ncbi:hypothetical protein SNE40_014541 [Patella caerulea]|uniref:Phenazine biosynthesis-like domain-containing protein n=1 Tax=Patella caerulea TaxID=87958 RepID=A0AAN8PQP7_PATCE